MIHYFRYMYRGAKMKLIPIVVVIICICFPVGAQSLSGFGVHGGIGTDISLGLGFGGGANYVLQADWLAYEFGIDIYYAHSDVSAPDGPMNYIYRDVTTTIFYAAAFNMLFNYLPKSAGFYFIVGTGAGAANVDWVGSSTDDPTYNDSWNRTLGGTLVNFGAGYTFGNGIELRLQAPILIIFDGPLAPLLNLSAGYRF
jgi:hypothetical protein